MRPRIALRSPRPSLHWQVPRQRPHSTAPPSQATLTSSSGHAFRWGLGAGAALTVAGAWLYLYSQSPVLLDAPGRLPVVERRKEKRTVTADEVAKHNTRESLWMCIEDEVWDVTDFVEMHPGGAKVLEQNAGKDVTKLFKSLHPPNTLRKFLTEDQLIGRIDVDEVTKIGGGKNAEDVRIELARKELRNVETVVSIDEFEELAQSILSEMAMSYYGTGSETEQTLRDEREAWQRVRFRPRVLRKMRHIDTNTTFCGIPTPLPIFVAPAGLARLGHPDGEQNIVRGVAPHNILQVVSSGASCSIDEIFAVKEPDQNLAWQFYVNSDKTIAEQKLKKALELGAKAIFVTVDVPVLGKRERDLKLKARSQNYEHPIAAQFKAAGSKVAAFDSSVGQKGVSDIPDTAHIDANLNWDDIAWIRERAPGVPIVIKGVGCVEDVELAHQYGADGVVLSTHGGRQLDGARAPLDVLIEVRRKNPELLKKVEVFIDGGARRGTDVVKALCLGARGVGFGRPFLYAQSVYAHEGVSKAVEILEAEVHMAMRLLGANTLADLKPEMVECSFPERWVPQ
ncbi:L-mandelate dehydrogenase [Rhodotorula diobovata]|uniref:L-mandelate dehydrogenase n=1 Tax=Rhodotorula diobovata TaxID=5288 RepID=A0A5C5FYZ6_9BASI|nr:L-mandelate dehydrogenase [Rhodotorula diobovata]